MKVVGLAGMPASGKSEVRAMFEAKGWAVYRMGDFVVAEVRARGLEPDSTNTGRIASEMREREGRDVWAVRTCAAVLRDGARRVVIDGMRSPYERDAFRRGLGDDFIIMAVLCPRPIRLARILARKREDDAGSEEAFAARDRRELTWGLGELIAEADVYVMNDGTLPALKRRVAGLGML